MSAPDTIWNYDELLAQVGLPPEGAHSVGSLLAETPPEFREIVQYAAIWGISDDGYREDLVNNASDDARLNLKWIVEKYEFQLERWLAGPEADAEDFTDAYIAFTAMIMASDSIVAKPSTLH